MTGLRWLVLVSLSVGCVHDQLESCGDLLCSLETVCYANACVVPAQLEACVGVVDGEACDAVINGTCNGGVCTSSICGDNIVGPAEKCDDGNLVSGDGCSLDCRSTETCGNGVPDFATGEQCDGGLAGLSGDGCSSTCKIEIGLWRDMTMTTHGPADRAVMVYDRARERLVMVSDPADRMTTRLETWEWIGGAMNRVTTAVAPPKGSFEATYDDERHCTVLYAGDGQTWEWDGVAWHDRTATPAPMTSSAVAMAYDGERRKTILFTGTETWAWNGTWTLLAPTSMPPGINGPGAMAYDEVRKQIVWFGGDIAQTWLWNGSNWTQVTTSAIPHYRVSHRMVWDPMTNTVLMIGGRWGTGGTDPDQWYWNGSNWSSSSVGPPQLWAHAMAFDEARQRLVLFGGDDNVYDSDSLANEWAFTEGAWSLVYSDPLPNSPGSLVYDAARTRLVAIGRSSYNGREEAWWWDGSIWHYLQELVNAYASHAVYHDARGSIMIWGPNGFWELVGSDVVSHALPIEQPTSGALAYDPTRGVLELFATGRTLTWDGATWSERANPLEVISLAVAAYDRRRERMVLAYSTVDGAELWESDGTTWTEITDPIVTNLRISLTYDEARSVIVVMADDGRFLDWDGTTFTEIESQTFGPPLTTRALAFDAVHGQLVAHGGMNSDPWTKSTWVFRMESKLRETCRATEDDDLDGLRGCADPDCWALCTPTCSPTTRTCTAEPNCGDSVCGGPETYLNCPNDCAGP